MSETRKLATPYAFHPTSRDWAQVRRVPRSYRLPTGAGGKTMMQPDARVP
jgi:hypothetical protein